ncbi:hypothetical protein [Ornithinimicrobium sediminis]|uniref:hypothetical protein n=1 Tax=Ornithinimicrobium sediminis TaxID=2904603 RepID=UPI001E4244AD|nr:hypothetical protein [Ornithinimicrobium sediminis]MCE0487822.1 hypothetical protein [Ornithinimicrobium sediminis]
MSHLSPEELDRLERLAFGIREFFSERGHNIGTALDQDPCFREGERGRSGLARSMMQSAVAAAVGGVELDLETGDGGVRLVRSIDRRYLRRYRVLAASKHEDDFRILSSSDNILQTDSDSLFFEEPWVLAYTLNQDNQVEDLFVAQVLDRLDGTPGALVLGPEYMLVGRPPTGDGGFQPTDEDLPMDDFEEEGEEGAVGAG